MWGHIRYLKTVPTDLLAVFASVPLAALAMVSGLDGLPLRLFAAAPLLAFTPGYVVVAAAWPSDDPGDGISRAERVGLSFLISAVLVTVTGMLLNVAEVSIGLAPILAVSGGVTIVGAAVATRRRRALPPADRFSWSTSRRPNIGGWSRPETRLEWLVLLSLVLAAGVALSSIGVAITDTTSGDPYTEFYLLTPNGSNPSVMATYPLDPNDTASIIVGLSNHEGRSMTYTVVVQRHSYVRRNGSLTVIDEREVGRFHPDVDPGQSWETEQQLQFEPADRPVRVSYLLYRGSPPADPSMETAYRHTYLWFGIEADLNDAAGQ